MTQQHRLCALPHLFISGDLGGLQFPLSKVRDLVDDDPGDATSKVDDLVQEEGHETGGDDGVADHGVPGDCSRRRVSY